jgi:hypothetical protein
LVDEVVWEESFQQEGSGRESALSVAGGLPPRRSIASWRDSEMRTPRLLLLMVAGLLVVSSLAASAKSPGGVKPGGKKALGEVTSFDSSSMALSVEMADGRVYDGEVSPDVKVKLEHRGNHSTGRGHGNPTRGSLEDIVAGAFVLRMKGDKADLVTKLRLRAGPVVTVTATPTPLPTESPTPLPTETPTPLPVP